MNEGIKLIIVIACGIISYFVGIFVGMRINTSDITWQNGYNKGYDDAKKRTKNQAAKKSPIIKFLLTKEDSNICSVIKCRSKNCLKIHREKK